MHFSAASWSQIYKFMGTRRSQLAQGPNISIPELNMSYPFPPGIKSWTSLIKHCLVLKEILSNTYIISFDYVHLLFYFIHTLNKSKHTRITEIFFQPITDGLTCNTCVNSSSIDQCTADVTCQPDEVWQET